MSRFWTVAVCSFLLLVSLTAVGWYYTGSTITTAYVLNDDEVESIAAELYGSEPPLSDIAEVPQMEIPKEYIPQILEALRPIIILRNRNLWNKLPPLGRMTIKKLDHTQVEISWHLWGQNSLAVR